MARIGKSSSSYRNLLGSDLLDVEKRAEQQAGWLLAATVIVMNVVAELEYVGKEPAFRLFYLTFSAVLVLWFAGSAIVIGTGRYRQWFKYVNLIIQVTTVTFFLLVTAQLRGAEFALGSTAPLLYVLVIGLSSLTFDPLLCVLAGGFAAGQFLGAYGFDLYGQGDAEQLVGTAAGWNSVALKSVIFVAMGIGAMLMARKARSLLTMVADQVQYQEQLRYVDQDMAQAAEIQERLIPTQLPQAKQVELASFYRPSRQVGGDYFDVIKRTDGRLDLVVADVAGKGYAAALLMANIQSVIQLLVRQGSELDEIIRVLNNAVQRAGAGGRFVSLVYLQIDSSARCVRYVNCGHNAPVLVAPDCQVATLRAHAPVLGVIDEISPIVETASFDPGATLFIYTDGLTELKNAHGAQLGEPAVFELVGSHCGAPVSVLKKAVLTAVDNYVGDEAPADDLSFVCVRALDADAVKAP